MLNKKTILLFLVLFVLVFIYFYSVINVEVVKSIEGVIVSTDMDVQEEVLVTINGELDNRLLEENVLLIRIAFGNKSYDAMLKKENEYYQGTAYIVKDNNELTEAGSVALSTNFDFFWADIDEIDEEYNLDTLIVAPAKNKEEAINVEKEIFGK
ncbi:MAG: hypothetical protein AB7V16_08395 [Vulcanibacillus sp.]